MQLPLEIDARHMSLNGAIEDLIRERADHLEHYFSRIISCHVILEGPSAHHKSGGSYDVHIDLRVPGREIVVSHQKGGELPAAIRAAFEAARRQLQDYVARLRAGTKHNGPQPRLEEEDGAGPSGESLTAE